MKRHLIIFAKEPQEETVKTRLKNYLPTRLRINLYKAFLKDTIDIAKKVNCVKRIIAYESSGKEPRYLKRIAKEFEFYEQKGINLGEKMYNAFKFSKMSGASKIVIIGSDSPTLPASYIGEAFGKLATYDIVLGPCDDGGYYLVGLKKPCLGIFAGVQWSSRDVLEKTLKNAKSLGKTAALLDKWYDVDDYDSLCRLKSDLREKNTCRWTKEFFKFCELPQR